MYGLYYKKKKAEIVKALWKKGKNKGLENGETTRAR